MNSENILVTEFFRFEKNYILGKIPLADFSLDLELLIEKMKDHVPEIDFENMMDCFYAIEDINSETIEGERFPSEMECEKIKFYLESIKNCVIKNIEDEE